MPIIIPNFVQWRTNFFININQSSNRIFKNIVSGFEATTPNCGHQIGPLENVYRTALHISSKTNRYLLIEHLIIRTIRITYSYNYIWN